MCIAILNTKGATLKKQLLSNCWENNGDGAGILYIDNYNQLQTFKTLDSFDEFYENYISIKQTFGRRNMLLHFRISTHGTINEENCHPFIVDDNVGFIHNGMISNVPDSVQYSDTNMLNRTLLQKMKVGFEQDDDVLDFLMSLIGSGNKLVFLNKNNEWSIVNETAGHWHLGCWFSNDSYKAVNDWYDFGGVKKKKSKGSRVGFTPQYSYQDFYKDYDYNDGFGTAKDEYCHDCGINLYGENEIARGNCNYCSRDEKEEENKKKEREAMCDSCNWHDGEYKQEWDAHICDECMDALNGELGA
jgi:hypothetical protein